MEEVVERGMYTVAEAGRVLHRHPNTVRRLCRMGRIVSNCDRGGFLISGRALLAYAEGRLAVKNQSQ